MTEKSEPLVAEYSIVMSAPAQRAFALIEDAVRWPQHFTPVVHTERTQESADRDELRIWGLRGEDAVRVWTARRVFDRAGLRISFTNEPAVAPLAASGGEWSFTDQGDGTSRVTVRHEFTMLPDADVPAERIAEELGKHSRKQLEELKLAAELGDELDRLVVDFEDPLFIGGAVEDSWAILYEADKWPERLAHVHKLTMTEDVPNIQFFDMDTTTPDGRGHFTRSVRVCLPHGKIVYKQVTPPPLLTAHTGHWAWVETPEGHLLSSRHTVTINPAKLALLGEGTTVEDARKYLRRVLSTNSMTNLRLAKTYAEERAGV
ncbi:aromatase/cyclase [Kitasatospora sp. NPDC101235]|uniref:aromatase/cyclase n=1 Tax=Kitasatospora sp. NPDC101235 TaxID=3364101 RepID=UPI0038252826